MRIASYQPQHIYPDVQTLDKTAYKQGMWAFIRRFQQAHEGEAAFYQFGVVRTPGVSDIDLLIVTRDETWKRAIEIADKVIEDSERLRYLFVHPPVVVCESLVEHLSFFHTLEECRWIDGEWDPLANLDCSHTSILSDDMRLIRHSVWNSFMRIAALEMDGSTIGLRRVLTLLHNLLTSAKCGNDFLKHPVSISMTTEDIREIVLATPEVKRAAVVRSIIEQVIDLLNAVDDQLDQELRAVPAAPIVVPSSKHYLVAPLSVKPELRLNIWCAPVLESIYIIQTPSYLITLTARLAQQVDDLLPDMTVFADLDLTSNFLEIDVTAYARRLRATYQIFQKAGVPNSFVRPFSHRTRSLRQRQRLAWWLRDRVLRWQARQWQVA